MWLARDHTLYPGSWSKWKLPLNKVTAGDAQQAKQWMWKLSLPLATKLSLITVCKGWVIRTRSFVFPASALKNMHVVTRKLDLNQTSVAPTMLKNIDKTNFFNGKTVPVDLAFVLEYFFVAGTTYQQSQQSSGGSGQRPCFVLTGAPEAEKSKKKTILFYERTKWKMQVALKTCTHFLLQTCGAINIYTIACVFFLCKYAKHLRITKTHK